MKDIEEELFELDGKKYLVRTKVIDNCKSHENLYKAFSLYALERLNKNEKKV